MAKEMTTKEVHEWIAELVVTANRSPVEADAMLLQLGRTDLRLVFAFIFNKWMEMAMQNMRDAIASGRVVVSDEPEGESNDADQEG